MKQKKLTFSRYFAESYDKNRDPVGHLSWEEHLKSQLNKQGYVVKDVKRFETITIQYIGARANIPLKERIRWQKKIDEKPYKEPYISGMR